jgi:hypothetical protein
LAPGWAMTGTAESTTAPAIAMIPFHMTRVFIDINPL